MRVGVVVLFLTISCSITIGVRIVGVCPLLHLVVVVDTIVVAVRVPIVGPEAAFFVIGESVTIGIGVVEEPVVRPPSPRTVADLFADILCILF
jgi:hypothetical protein